MTAGRPEYSDFLFIWLEKVYRDSLPSVCPFSGGDRRKETYMFCRINSIGISGMDGYQVSVEADVSNGLPGISMVGYLGSSVKEAKDRVMTALKNSGFHCQPKKITVNLSPAGVKKEGTVFDLAIAVAVLGAYGIINGKKLENVMIAGELGLNGEVKGIRGCLPMVMAARDHGFSRCFLPRENCREGQAAGALPVIGVSSLRELTELLNQGEEYWTEEAVAEQEEEKQEEGGLDYKDIMGQAHLKRAAEIAAAGMHNLLIIGPAGTGKSMTARRIPTIMPPLTLEEKREISKVYSICGLLPEGQALISSRPFRSPHHTATIQAIAGGGRGPKPGEVSLASGGVLFLDEFPEFSRNVIELLRQPLEDRSIVVARTAGAYRFPADFMLVAASNPCPCGCYPDRTKCHCSETQIRKYLGKMSRPILDRMDLIAEAAAISYEDIAGKRNMEESSAQIRDRVEKAWQIQRKRFQGRKTLFNSRMTREELEQFCSLGPEEEYLMKQLYEMEELSGRGRDRVLKVARTIADLSGSPAIKREHLLEAAGYRSSIGIFGGGWEHE